MSWYAGLVRIPATAFIAMVVAGAGIACAAEGGVDAASPLAPGVVSLLEVKSLLESHCGTCHNPDEKAAQLNLVGDEILKNLVGVASTEVPALMRIEPSQPQRSYLLLKIEGNHLKAGGQGLTMPPEGSLAPGEISLIRDWIVAGAMQ